jgi:uncharacterized membrane protein (DUF441 family)
VNAPDLYALQPDLGGLLTLAITVLIPILVGFITKRGDPKRLKALILLALTFVSTFLQAWLGALQADVPFNWVVVLYNLVVNFVISVAVQRGLWRPSGVTDTVQDMGNHD